MGSFRLRETRNKTGSFLCDRETFEMIYDLQLRRLERRDEVFTLMKVVVEEIQKRHAFLHFVSNFLRKGDVVCKWEDGTFYLILDQADHREAEIIQERIEKAIAYHSLTLVSINIYTISGPDDHLQLQECG